VNASFPLGSSAIPTRVLLIVDGVAGNSVNLPLVFTSSIVELTAPFVNETVSSGPAVIWSTVIPLI
jgi:hypothetical protein